MFNHNASTTSNRQQALRHRSKHLSHSKMSSIISVEALSVEFENNIQALKSVELEVAKGEILFITGASGAGKTTLLKAISGELKNFSGKIKRQKNLFLSQVFQNLCLLESRSCLENLMISYDPLIYQSKTEFKSDLMDFARYLGIAERLDLRISKANGGLRQKVAIIRALLGKPDIFIADEPTASLDGESAKRIFELLNLYNIKKGLTIVWATHNRELVKKFTGRIVHLDGGRLIYSGNACFI